MVALKVPIAFSISVRFSLSPCYNESNSEELSSCVIDI
jgi:hypothetical protein